PAGGTREALNPVVDRSGFTLVEMVIALTVLGVVITSALGFLNSQNRAFGHGVARVDLFRNLAYVSSTLRQDLRTTGTNLAPGQPFVVYAGGDVLAVNADYATNLSDDPFAVYSDPDAPAGSVGVLRREDRSTLPGTTFVYPDSTYREAGVPGAAETLIFRFAEDSMTADPGDYVLYRQVNAGAREVVARHLARTDGSPFFEYLADDGDRLTPIAAGRLPVRHGVTVHGAPGDTMPLALVDSVRAVRVRVSAIATGEAPVSAETTIRFPNAGLQRERSCGSPPILGQALNTTGRVVDGQSEVELTWSPAVDETGGEGDVIRYVLWKEGGGHGGDEPFLSIPAGRSGYQFVDRDVTAGATYTYRLAAQDCSPSLSPASTAVVNTP
ncbi:MAG TPA: prepilin-type N-terminal cleavage/methylation domain-containing protein, partial [Longimicrobiales bacterium]|nr:prepilin-type N-terminal cleavage/methylation domain-containing protein [Longimicrobiales bacterium]